MKTKRLLALLSAGALSVSMLAGCGSTAKTDDTASGSAAADTSASADSDLEYVKSQGKLVVGITDFAPMDYKEDGSDEWIGFDADMAKAAQWCVEQGIMEAKTAETFKPEGWTPKFKVIEVWNKAFPKQ